MLVIYDSSLTQEACGLINLMQPQYPYEPPKPEAPQQPPVVVPPTGPEHPAYDFIINNQAPKRGPGFSLPGLSSPLLTRVLALVGVVFVVVILLIIISAVAKGPSDASQLTAAVQDQQEILHLASEATQQPSLSSANQSLVVTLTAAVGTSQAQLIQYLANGKHKLSSVEMNFKESSSIDQQLTQSISTDSFNTVLDNVLQTQFKTYANDLALAYNATHSKIVKASLHKDYVQIDDFDKQLALANG